MHKFLILAAFVCGSSQAEQPKPLPIEACAEHVPYGVPTVQKQDVATICRGAYLTVHDNRAKIPVYASYLLKPENVVSACSLRDNTFEVDRSLPPLSRSGNKDYAKSGYDTGHLVNAEDLKYSEAAQDVAALLSNATPQLPGFNRGVWKKLEDQTRGWSITRRNPILVYVGPIYDRKSDSTIGKGFVTVPNGFFKVLIDIKTNEVQAFVFKHESSTADLKTFLTSVAEVQKRSGLALPLPTKPIVAQSIWPVTFKSAQTKRVCATK